MGFLFNFTEKAQKLLANKSTFFNTVFIGLAAFSTYSCMYAFRKPFTAGLYEGIFLWGMNYKLVLVLSQLIGYTAAKGLGIKFVSEMKADQRPKYIIGLVAYSQLALFMFWIVPSPDNWPFMCLNGLGLGMIYGIVFSYLEGRKITELLSAFLIVSFIVSSGFLKSIGKFFLLNQVSEAMMPFLVGLIFFPIFLLSVFALNLAPNPTADDINSRNIRQPMNNKERAIFLKKYGFGLCSLILVYILMTVFRDLRDNFSVEIWHELGINNSSIFSQTELIIGLIITINICLGNLIKSNKQALLANHFFIILGCLLVVVSTRSFMQNYTSAFWWMVLSGLGIYMAYIPFNGVLFDRLLAVLKEKANVGFLFYLADFAGYIGSIFVMLFQNFSPKKQSWLGLITDLSLWLPIISIIFVLFSLQFFIAKTNNNTSIQNSLPTPE
jgi:Family of unknown function (DUF5690)